MAIPEHVKRQAMDAVSHRETTAMIRAFGATPVLEGSLFTHRQDARPEVRPIPEHVKRQALDAVSHSETRSQIRLVKDTGQVTPPATPSRESERIAGKIAAMQRDGHGQDFMHKTITQDGFGREHYG